jgi:hypothetical protein
LIVGFADGADAVSLDEFSRGIRGRQGGDTKLLPCRAAGRWPWGVEKEAAGWAPGAEPSVQQALRAAASTALGSRDERRL